MAKLSGDLGFTGTLGNVSAYKMRGVKGLIIRTKGGASKEKIKTSPGFKLTRDANAEFGGRARASKWIMHALWPQKPLADYNVAGPLNALLKPIQNLDSSNLFGQRNIELSKNPQLLEGFSLNHDNPFDSTVRTALSYTLSRDTMAAVLDIPALLPGINFFAPAQYAMFRVQVTLGIVPDLFYADPAYLPSNNGYHLNDLKMVATDWCAVQKGSAAVHLALNFDRLPSDNSFSVMLAVGVCYGRMIDTTTIEQVAHAGCAKILAMA